jgi:hypothetical protein
VTAQDLRRKESSLPPSGRAGRNGVLVLGWSQFWLFSGILGSLLAMFLVILFAHLSSL